MDFVEDTRYIFEDTGDIFEKGRDINEAWDIFKETRDIEDSIKLEDILHQIDKDKEIIEDITRYMQRTPKCVR